MKIVIGGSMSFAKEQIETRNILEKNGYTVLLTDDIENYANDDSIKKSFEEELKLCLEYDVMRSFFNKIAGADAFLVMNYPKNGINGYLGTSVLMELGLAYHLKKKIFLLYPVDQNQSYNLELAVINPAVLNGDLKGIK